MLRISRAFLTTRSPTAGVAPCIPDGLNSSQRPILRTATSLIVCLLCRRHLTPTYRPRGSYTSEGPLTFDFVPLLEIAGLCDACLRPDVCFGKAGLRRARGLQPEMLDGGRKTRENRIGGFRLVSIVADQNVARPHVYRLWVCSSTHSGFW